MKRNKLQTMYFGTGRGRIAISHLNAPIELGLVGMAQSKLFADTIAIAIDEHSPLDYNYACLGYAAGGKSPRILLEREVFYDFKRGTPKARLILLHEIGHYYNADHQSQKGVTDGARCETLSCGAVHSSELAADAFAAHYLGTPTAICGLQELKSDILTRYPVGMYRAEDINAAVTEIDLRIASCAKGACDGHNE